LKLNQLLNPKIGEISNSFNLVSEIVHINEFMANFYKVPIVSLDLWIKMDALQYFLSKCIRAMGDFSTIFFNFVILNHIWPQICDILPIENQTFVLEIL
jgi:hypothetical protein